MTKREETICDIRKFMKREEDLKRENLTRSKKLEEEKRKKYQRITKKDRGVYYLNQGLLSRSQAEESIELHKKTKEDIYYEEFVEYYEEAIYFFEKSYNEGDCFKSSVCKDEMILWRKQIDLYLSNEEKKEKTKEKIQRKNDFIYYSIMCLCSAILLVCLFLYL